LKVYITSDQHYFDKQAIQYNNRPYDLSFDGMIENAIDMFNNFNSVVEKDDLTIFLGDVAFITSKSKAIFKEMAKNLYGNKILVLGNHDRKTEEFYKNCGFLAVTDYIKIGRYFLCHYPLDRCFSSHEKHLLSICKQLKCDTIIHGHVHDLDIIDTDFERINVSVDHHEMMPVQFNQKIFKTFASNFLKDKFLPHSKDFEIFEHISHKMPNKHFKIEPLRIEHRKAV